MISRTLYKVSAWVTTKSLREGDSFIEVCLYRFHCTTMFLHVILTQMEECHTMWQDSLEHRTLNKFCLANICRNNIFCWSIAQLYQGSIAMTEVKKRHHRQEIKNTMESLSVFFFWLTGLLSTPEAGDWISPGFYEHGPWLLSLENRRKIEPKEIPSCLIPRLLVVFTQHLEILVTALD